MSEALGESQRPARPKPAAGWYPHASTPGAQRYWDGDKWTDHLAPIPPQPQKATGVLTIARGVALGLLATIAIIAIWYGIATSNDPLECAIRNAERATGDRAGPFEVCPD